MQARCMKCKDNKDMKDIQIVKTKRGGFMAKGKCVQCECGMCKIMSKDQASQLASELNVQLPE
jgi:hypothetical protein